MSATNVTLACPSCGFSKDVPAENITPLPLNATCPTCVIMVFSALFGWLIKRFTSAEIRREF